jgi:hypothetical protein
MAGKTGIGDDRLGAGGDDFYAQLIAAHEGLSFEDSARLNARLVLILANAVGDPVTVAEAIRLASIEFRRDSVHNPK